jgi:hypothetical protein
MEFFRLVTDKAVVLRDALQSPLERGTLLRMWPILEGSVRRALFEDLVRCASCGHSDIELCRNAILFDRDWAIQHIDDIVGQILRNGGAEEYRRFAELYRDISPKLLSGLVQRAREHDDSEIREVGDDFLEYVNGLDKPSG